jgi:hypothetical protein
MSEAIIVGTLSAFLAIIAVVIGIVVTYKKG